MYSKLSKQSVRFNNWFESFDSEMSRAKNCSKMLMEYSFRKNDIFIKELKEKENSQTERWGIGSWSWISNTTPFTRTRTFPGPKIWFIKNDLIYRHGYNYGIIGNDIIGYILVAICRYVYHAVTLPRYAAFDLIQCMRSEIIMWS